MRIVSVINRLNCESKMLSYMAYLEGCLLEEERVLVIDLEYRKNNIFSSEGYGDYYTINQYVKEQLGINKKHLTFNSNYIQNKKFIINKERDSKREEYINTNAHCHISNEELGYSYIGNTKNLLNELQQLYIERGIEYSQSSNDIADTLREMISNLDIQYDVIILNCPEDTILLESCIKISDFYICSLNLNEDNNDEIRELIEKNSNIKRQYNPNEPIIGCYYFNKVKRNNMWKPIREECIKLESIRNDIGNDFNIYFGNIILNDPDIQNSDYVIDFIGNENYFIEETSKSIFGMLQLTGETLEGRLANKIKILTQMIHFNRYMRELDL